MSSALPSQGHHVRELFGQSGPGATSFQYEQKESKASYNISSKKKSKAPPPPAGGLGQYKPKILSVDPEINVPLNIASSPTVDDASTLPVRPPRKGRAPNVPVNTNNGGQSNNGIAKAFIIGDKNVPMVLHGPEEEDLTTDLERDVSDLQLLTSIDGMPGYEQQGTENPLFRMKEGEEDQRDDEEEEEEAVMDFSGSVAEQAIRDSNGRIYQNGNTFAGRKVKGDKGGEPDGVFIPDPDYDEEEKTMVLDEEEGVNDYDPASHRGQKVYKEYVGEDFSQYLSDEEQPIGQSLTYRPRRPVTHHTNMMERRAKTEAKRPHYKKRDSVLSSGGNKGNKSKERPMSASHSLRDFSFTDSKFGTLSHGNNKRHSLPDSSWEEAEMFIETGESYEKFLRQRNGDTPLDDTSSGLVDDNPFGQAAQGLPEIPPRYARGASSRDSLWKKLTWKFKTKVRSGFELNA